MHVLIVDDEVKLAATLKRGLEEQGHAVAVAHDGLTGLALAELGSFDVVVLDVLLPQLGGLDVARALRKRRIGVAILMLTARDTVDDRVAGLGAGAHACLV